MSEETTTPTIGELPAPPMWEAAGKWVVWGGTSVLGLVAVVAMGRVCWWLLTGDVSATAPVVLGLASILVLYFVVKREHRFRLRRDAVMALNDVYSRVLASAGGKSPDKTIKPFGLTQAAYHRAHLLGALFLPRSTLKELVENRQRMVDQPSDIGTFVTLVRELRKAGGQPTLGLQAHHLLGLYVNDIFPGGNKQADSDEDPSSSA